MSARSNGESLPLPASGIFLTFAFVLQAASPSADSALHGRRTPRAPVIDGRLDEPEWLLAPPLRSFVQNFPDENAAPTESTEVRLLYDDQALYVGMRCDDRDPVRIVAPMTRRDRADVETDYVAIQIDSRGDGRTAFGFALTPAGVQWDHVIFNDTEVSLDWDAVWPSATTRDGSGWTAELAIPLDVLRFDTASVARWRVYVRRNISRRKEVDEWPYLPRDRNALVSRFGPLLDVSGLRPRRAIYLSPYLGSEALYARRPAGDPTDPEGADGKLKAGLDAKLGISSALTLDATINPDFGQIEADQLVLNLTTFETFFREKRPFFLEGGDLFAPPVRGESFTEFPPLPALQLFHSRRVGRTPNPDDALTGTVASRIEPVTIAGAVKLSGRLGQRLTVGLLDAVTLAGEVTTDGSATPMPQPTREVMLPATNFAVLRLRRDVLSASAIGATVTATTPLELGQSFHSAYTGGVDFALQTPDHVYTALGQLVASTIEGGDLAHAKTAPDGTVLADGARGLGAQLQLAKEGGTHWLGKLYQEYESESLDLNDAGYLKRQNFLRSQGTLTYRDLKPRGFMQQYFVDLIAELAETADASTNVGRRLILHPEMVTRSFWTLGWVFWGELPSYDVRETEDGAHLERAPYLAGGPYGTTDTRRRVFTSFFGFGRVGGLYSGRRVHSYGTGADTTARLGTRTELFLSLFYFRQVDAPRFEYRDDTAAQPLYYLAPLDAQSVSCTLRAAVAIRPNLTLQSYAQLFFASGVFDGAFAEPALGPDRTLPLDGLQPAMLPPAAGDPNFHNVALNANLVLRWEYLPGSTLFLVVTHAQNEFLRDGAPVPVGLGAGRDLRALVDGPSTTAVLLKLSYFWKL